MEKKDALNFLNLSPATPNVHDEILKIAGNQVPYFRTKKFAAITQENEDLVLDLISCRDGRAIFLTASGSGAMDAAVSNLISEQDRVLVINGGSFGQRWKDICDFYKINNLEFKVPYGKNIDFLNLEKEIKKFTPTVILTQHVETSSGQKHDIQSMGNLSRNYGSFLIVDTIGSFANEELKMDDWNIDASIFSSQKGLGLFAGTSTVVLGKNALSKGFSKRNFYFDFAKYLENTGEMTFPFTPNSNNLMQVNFTLKRIKERGLEKKINQVKSQAEHFRNLAKDLPVSIVAENPCNCLTTLYTGKDVKDFFNKMQEKNIYFSPRGGARGEMVISHMGDLSFSDNTVFVDELKKWLNYRE